MISGGWARWYWSLGALPQWYRSRAAGWFVLCALGERPTKTLLHGLSTLMQYAFRMFFQRNTFRDFQTHGIVVRPPDSSPWVLKCEVRILIQDYKAFVELFHLFGPNGHKPCSLLCRNVVQHLDLEDGNYLVPMQWCRLSQCDLHTTSSLKQTIELMDSQKHVLADKDFKMLEQSTGIHHSPGPN